MVKRPLSDLAHRATPGIIAQSDIEAKTFGRVTWVP